MQTNKLDVREGARRIISKNLGMHEGEDLLVIVDEDTGPIGEVLVDAARSYSVRSTVIMVFKKDQPRYTNDQDFPLPLARAIDAAQAVVISLSDIPEGTGFRAHLLDISRGLNTKVALMPGVTLDMVAHLARVDYDILSSHANTLKSPLLLGRKVTILTSDRMGKNHELRLEIRGWDQPPTISTGIIHAQSFDNIPSGEVYIAPIKGTAQGEIIINGSITKHVFEQDQGDEIQLSFHEGVLVNIDPTDHPATAFIQKAIANARAYGDQEPDYLCELGIGISSGIAKLTGNTLLDEKALGTAHIAIGMNEPFGGNVDAHHLHEDMIFRKPTIVIDGKAVITDGAIKVSTKDWDFSFQDKRFSTSYLGDQIIIQSTGAEAEIDEGGQLYKKYFDGTDAPASVRVGDKETATITAKIYGQLSEFENEKISLQELSKATGLAPETLRPALYVMSEFFDLVEIHQ